jgi:alginate O-acetyltransferase complex protein AlgI
MITMLIGGLWHGAGWTFIVWGAFHGMLLVGYHALSSWGRFVPRPVAQLTTFVLVVIGWVFFRSTDMAMAGQLLDSMFTPTSGELPDEGIRFAWLVLVAAILATACPNVFEYHRSFRASLSQMLLVAATLGVSIALIAGSRESPFLYFQF